MSKKPIASTKLSDTLTISECHDGIWLYDETRGMNLAMKAKTRDEAFTDALSYYQERLSKVEKEYRTLQSKVLTFVEKFVDTEDDIEI